jgi:hypothetical protein
MGHWWQLGGRCDEIDTGFSKGTPTIPAEGHLREKIQVPSFRNGVGQLVESFGANISEDRRG